MRREGDHVVETAVEARAGYLDRPVAKVLATSTVLVIVLFAVIYYAYMS